MAKFPLTHDVNPSSFISRGITGRPASLETSQKWMGSDRDIRWLEQFSTSMPERYRQVFGRESTRLHARIAQSRGDNLLHLESVPTEIDEEPELCVVAINFPGLLAATSAALALETLDVSRADVYQRRTSLGDDEMLALFCLRQGGRIRREPFDSERLSRLKARMLELLRSQDFAPRFQEASYTNHLQKGDAIASFRIIRGTTRITIELHCRYHTGILAAVTTALAKQGVLIVDARVRSNESRFHVYLEIEEPLGSHPTYVRGAQLLNVVVDAASAVSVGAACTADNNQGSVVAHCSASGACSAPLGTPQWSRISECCV